MKNYQPIGQQKVSLGIFFRNIWARGKNTIIGSLFLGSLLGLTLIQNHLNQKPAKKELSVLQVEIIDSFKFKPHAVGKLKNGDVIGLMFATPFNLTGKGNYYNGLSKEEQKLLLGCNAIIEGLPLKFTTDNFFRIWSLKCNDFNLTYEKSEKQFYENSESMDYILRFVFLAYFLILCLVFYIEGKRK